MQPEQAEAAQFGPEGRQRLRLGFEQATGHRAGLMAGQEARRRFARGRGALQKWRSTWINIYPISGACTCEDSTCQPAVGLVTSARAGHRWPGRVMIQPGHRSCGGRFSAVTALGSVASVHPKHSRDTNAYLEDVLRKSRADTCDLLDAIGTGFLLFLVSQRWQSAWIDAIPRNLEVRRPNCLLDFCRESRFDSVWKRQVENLHPCLGRSLCVCHLHDSHVGDGLGCLVPVPQVSGNRVLPGPWTVTSNPGTCQLLSGPRSLFPSHLA